MILLLYLVQFRFTRQRPTLYNFTFLFFAASEDSSGLIKIVSGIYQSIYFDISKQENEKAKLEQDNVAYVPLL